MTGPGVRLHGLPPVANDASRILILGSMPGGLSLSKQEYYGNPRNHFWRLIYALFGSAEPSAEYGKRLAFALSHRIALWDVLAACIRKGSLDTAIREPEANDFAAFFRAFPGVERVYFNGQTAEKLYRRKVLPLLKEQGLGLCIRYATLPSSSPARTMAWEAKLEAWRRITRDG